MDRVYMYLLQKSHEIFMGRCFVSKLVGNDE